MPSNETKECWIGNEMGKCGCCFKWSRYLCSYQLLRMEGCLVLSAADPPRPYSRRSRPEPLLFLQVAPQLYWRGGVDPVPDPLLPRKSGSARNRTRTSGSVAWNWDHRGGLRFCFNCLIFSTKNFLWMLSIVGLISMYDVSMKIDSPSTRRQLLVEIKGTWFCRSI
jgi:hypothetical protein